MSERDAFGREIGEDALKEMGWGSSQEAPPVRPGDRLALTDTFAAGEATAPFTLPRRHRPEPEREQTMVEPAQAPAAPIRRRPVLGRPRRRGPGAATIAKLIIAVAILGAGAIAVSAAVNLGKDAISGIKGKIDAIASPQPPTAASSKSLLRPAPLEDALAKLPDGRLVSLRVAVDRIDAQVISGKSRHRVQVDAGGKTTDVTVPAFGGAEPRLTVNVQAPMRMARTVARRANLKVGDVDYLVLTDQGWLLYFKHDGPHYRADSSGRAVEKF